MINIVLDLTSLCKKALQTYYQWWKEWYSFQQITWMWSDKMLDLTMSYEKYQILNTCIEWVILTIPWTNSNWSFVDVQKRPNTMTCTMCIVKTNIPKWFPCKDIKYMASTTFRKNSTCQTYMTFQDSCKTFFLMFGGCSEMYCSCDISCTI